MPYKMLNPEVPKVNNFISRGYINMRYKKHLLKLQLNISQAKGRKIMP